MQRKQKKSVRKEVVPNEIWCDNCCQYLRIVHDYDAIHTCYDFRAVELARCTKEELMADIVMMRKHHRYYYVD